MKTKMTVITENYVGKSGLLGEHGFSALIDGPKGRFLFDTGPGMSLPHNVDKLNIDLRSIDTIILSHGHYDHTGGLKWVLEQVGPKEVVASSHLFMPHMAIDPQNPAKGARSVGCPFKQGELEALGAQFVFLDQTTEIQEGVWFVTGYPRPVETVPNDPKLVVVENGRIVPDSLPDDSCLLIEDGPAPILFLGCTHSGIINTLLHLKREMGISRLKAVMGGTHLMASDGPAVERVMEIFDEFSVELIGTSHCTGFKASVMMAARFKERFIQAATGNVVTI